MIPLAGLAVFSGLSLNLLLQFALGTTGVASDSSHKKDPGRRLPLEQFGILFVSVLFLWILFNYMVPAYWRGFSEYFLYFPLSALVCMGFELLCERILPRLLPQNSADKNPKPGEKKIFSAISAYDGLVPASLMITSFVADSFTGAFVLALFFAAGNLAAMLILNEIRRRSALEWVPRYLRGSPLILVSMGLLSLISASAAGICLKILEIF